MIKRLECRIKGRVQLVMFRDFTQRQARGLRIVGEVWNNPDGAVEVTAEGEEKDLIKFLTTLRRGPLFARVAEVNARWLEPRGNYESFRIGFKKIFNQDEK